MKNLVFVLLFFLLFHIPQSFSDSLHSWHVAMANPLFSFFTTDKKNLSTSESEAVSRLRLENQMLLTQLDAVKEWLQFSERIEKLSELYTSISSEKNSFVAQEFFQRRSDRLSNLLNVYLQAVPAKIIFRDPSFFSSTCWINVGSKDNAYLEKKIIAKNSPIVVGDNLVGVIEYVGKTQSKVRLLSDSGFIPSVRAMRGQTQNDILYQHLLTFWTHITPRKDLFSSEKEYEYFCALLKKIQNKVGIPSQDYYLAKGELKGTSAPLWRHSNTLQGIGFNYDYDDEKGPARDLRTAQVLQGKEEAAPNILLQEGDLLVTTGMDGIFPEGLHVAIVMEVDELEEGSYAYSLTAKPSVGDLRNIQHVFVLPPIDEGNDKYGQSLVK